MEKLLEVSNLSIGISKGKNVLKLVDDVSFLLKREKF